jgi:hypothetical protein
MDLSLDQTPLTTILGSDYTILLISEAKIYALANGVILIVDFSDSGGDIRQKKFVGDDG